MFDFFASWGWWLLIVFIFMSKCLAALGIFGRGASQDKLPGIGLIIFVICAVVIWVNYGFIAFVASIIFWFLMNPLANGLVLRWLGKLGVVSDDPTLAYELTLAQEQNSNIDFTWESITKRSDLMKQHADKAKTVILKDADVQLEFTKRNMSINEDLDEIIDLIQYNLGGLQEQTIVRILKRPDVLDTYYRWRNIRDRIESIESESKEQSSPELDKLKKALEKEYVDFQIALRGLHL